MPKTSRKFSTASAFERFLGLVLRDDVITDLRQRAYVLATVKHECARTWRPIAERYNGDPFKYFTDKYDGREDLGNTEPGDGYRFRGRGFVQLTGRSNYQKLSAVVGIDLVEKPDLALNEDVSFLILTAGMKFGEFTGKRLEQYVSADRADYRNARRVVNGLDKATLIAGYATKFESLLNTIRST